MSRQSTQSTRQNQKGYPKGSMAESLRRQQIAETRAKSARRVRGALAAVTLAATGAFVADGVMDMDRNHKQSVAVEAAKEAMQTGRVSGVDVNTNVYLRAGVIVRTAPKIIRSREEERGNELHKVGEDEVLVVSNPIQIQNEDGESYMMFTLSDGRTGYVSNEVIGQEDSDGNRFAIVAPEQQPQLPEQLNAGNLELNENTGAFTIDGYEVGMAQTMSPQDALEHMA